MFRSTGFQNAIPHPSGYTGLQLLKEHQTSDQAGIVLNAPLDIRGSSGSWVAHQSHGWMQSVLLNGTDITNE